MFDRPLRDQGKVDDVRVRAARAIASVPIPDHDDWGTRSKRRETSPTLDLEGNVPPSLRREPAPY